MDATRFDRVAMLFAQRAPEHRLSRRRALARGGAGLAAGALAATGYRATAQAQDATPDADAGTGQKTTYLFVQSFQSGSIAAKEGADGTYTVTLEQGLGQTIYFADRPSRDVGTVPTPQFLDGLGFPPDNPPNAALVMETAPGQTDLAVVELFSPVYDEATHTATYDVRVLANWETSLDLGFSAAPTDLARVAPSFGPAHLFIDDCTFGLVSCLYGYFLIGELAYGPQCWYPEHSRCLPCEPNDHDTVPSMPEFQQYWNPVCNFGFPECHDRCVAEFVSFSDL